MSLILQVKEPIKRLELVDVLHKAMTEVQTPSFRLVSTTADSDLQSEDPLWSSPNMGGFEYRGNSGSVVYLRDFQTYMGGEPLTQPPRSPEVARTVERLERRPRSFELATKIDLIQSQLQDIGMRGDALISFLIGSPLDLGHRTLESESYGSEGNAALQGVGLYLRQECLKIERTALLYTQKGSLSLKEL